MNPPNKSPKYPQIVSEGVRIRKGDPGEVRRQVSLRHWARRERNVQDDADRLMRAADIPCGECHENPPTHARPLVSFARRPATPDGIRGGTDFSSSRIRSRPNTLAARCRWTPIGSH